MRTTIARHFDMPARVSGPAELKRLPGVSHVRETKIDKPTRAKPSVQTKRRLARSRAAKDLL
jgi:hypothetical protein